MIAGAAVYPVFRGRVPRTGGLEKVPPGARSASIESMSGTNPTPAGWYDDGSGTGGLRYWDGDVWTEHTAPAATATASASPVETAAPVVTAPPAPETVPATETQPYGAAPAQPAYAAAVSGGTVLTDAPASAPAPKSKPHVLGIIALAVAAIGFIFACIPGALVVGWVLLPIAFVLSIVALFLKGAKWPAITGLIVSIVGTIVGTVVFFLVVSTSFSDAFDDVEGAIAEASQAAEESADDGAVVEEPEPPAVGNLAFGDTMIYEDGVELTVSAPEPYTAGEFAAGADQAANLVFTLTITNNSTENLDPLPFPRVSSGGTEASQIFDFTDDGVQVGLPPTNVILPGESVTWQSAWSVADAASLTMQVAPGFEYEDAVFTNVQ